MENETNTYEYKVLSQKDGELSSKFNTTKLEAILNTNAKLGWRLVASATAEIPGIMTGKREEIIFIMERLNEKSQGRK